MLASIVIRTLNEAVYLDDLLVMIGQQKTQGLDHEVVLIDSGSTDDTVEIARRHGCRITSITKQEFSFGRSLNWGGDFADGDILVFISGHCIPVDEHWLQTLCQPIIDGHAIYTYGRQVGDDDSHFSERRIFAKYYPENSMIPQQQGFFCNNANSALARASWDQHRFDEDLTGLEDMALGKRLVEDGEKLGYVAEAPVFHHHSESWAGIRRRFERESLALRQIMPEVQLSRLDVVRYIISSVCMDLRSASHHHNLRSHWYNILRYRIAQYTGSYVGNNDHRRMSQGRKERFFYPSVNESDVTNAWLKSHRRAPPHESQQSTGER